VADLPGPTRQHGSPTRRPGSPALAARPGNTAAETSVQSFVVTAEQSDTRELSRPVALHK